LNRQGAARVYRRIAERLQLAQFCSPFALTLESHAPISTPR